MWKIIFQSHPIERILISGMGWKKQYVTVEIGSPASAKSWKLVWRKTGIQHLKMFSGDLEGFPLGNGEIGQALSIKPLISDRKFFYIFDSFVCRIEIIYYGKSDWSADSKGFSGDLERFRSGAYETEQGLSDKPLISERKFFYIFDSMIWKYFRA